MVMMDPQMVAELPLWRSGLLLAGGAVIGAMIVEGTARKLIPHEVRAEHNTVTSAVFTVVGTTYAVLLAFVAMLALEGYNKADAVTAHEASLVEDVFHLLSGLSGPGPVDMQQDIVAYTRHVVANEWPAQARGQSVPEQVPNLQRLTKTALHVRLDDGDTTLHTILLEKVTALGAARRERLIAARTSVPAIVWFVLIAGGGISVSFASLLGAPKLAMQLVMSSLLALSGALMLLVIVALSNPFEGDLAISDQPFQRVLVEMAS